MSKHVGEKCGKLIAGETGWTDGSRPGHHQVQVQVQILYYSVTCHKNKYCTS